jgi:uncharacterized protein with ACT and thioredoxin-like domain
MVSLGAKIFDIFPRIVILGGGAALAIVGSGAVRIMYPHSVLRF